MFGILLDCKIEVTKAGFQPKPGFQNWMINPWTDAFCPVAHLPLRSGVQSGMPAWKVSWQIPLDSLFPPRDELGGRLVYEFWLRWTARFHLPRLTGLTPPSQHGGEQGLRGGQWQCGVGVRVRSPGRGSARGHAQGGDLPGAVSRRRRAARVRARGSAEAGDGEGRASPETEGGARSRHRGSSPAAGAVRWGEAAARPRPWPSSWAAQPRSRPRLPGLPRMEDSRETSPSSNNSSEELSSSLQLSKGMSIFLDVSSEGRSSICGPPASVPVPGRRGWPWCWSVGLAPRRPERTPLPLSVHQSKCRKNDRHSTCTQGCTPAARGLATLNEFQS